MLSKEVADRTPQSSWEPIQVPAEAVMQGFGIEHDQSFFLQANF